MLVFFVMFLSTSPLLRGQSEFVSSYICGLEEEHKISANTNPVADAGIVLKIDSRNDLPMNNLMSSLPMYTSSVRGIAGGIDSGLYCYFPPGSYYTVCSSDTYYLTLRRDNFSLTLLEYPNTPRLTYLATYSCEKN